VDLFQIDFGSRAGDAPRYAVETAVVSDAWSMAVDRTARADSAAVVSEPADRVESRYVRLTLTDAEPADTASVAEWRVFRSNPAGAHAPLLIGKKLKAVGTTTQFELEVRTAGRGGAFMLLRAVGEGAAFTAATGFRPGPSLVKKEFIKNGQFARVVAVSFLDGVECVSDTLWLDTRTTAVPDDRPVPAPGGFALEPNYPNPFNPATTLPFTVPAASRVVLTVHDAAGREVARPADGRFEAGRHSVRFDGSALATGVYVCRMRAGSVCAARKMLLLK
jgi:hypothetical protein